MRFGARLSMAAGLLTGLFSFAHAQSDSSSAKKNPTTPSFYASSERFGYVGTVSVYNTLTDAQRERNARFEAQIVPQRDGSIFVVKNAPDYFADSAAFITNWYDDAAGDNGGTDNPNNTDFGFVQLYDGLFGPLATVNNSSGFWNKKLDTFTVHVDGQNATYDNSFARLWNAGYTDIGGEGTKGTFVSYSYTMRASGLQGVDQGNGFIASTNNATDYSGSFDAIFLNQSVNSTESNGYYVVHLTFNNVSWAASNGYALDDQFGSNVVQNGNHFGQYK